MTLCLKQIFISSTCLICSVTWEDSVIIPLLVAVPETEGNASLFISIINYYKKFSVQKKIHKAQDVEALLNPNEMWKTEC